MTHVSIIGTGTMGQAIADVVTSGGNTVETLGRGDAGTPVSGDVVVLAVPYPALTQVLAERGEQLAGRPVDEDRHDRQDEERQRRGQGGAGDDPHSASWNPASSSARWHPPRTRPSTYRRAAAGERAPRTTPAP